MEFTHRIRSRRRISRELDHLCGINRGTEDLAALNVRKLREILRRLEAEGRDIDAGDYFADTGLTLGMPERRAAGLAMLERAA
jgi:hypothetical protein